MPPIIRWLHLSDFHMGKDAYGQGKIAEYILTHVAERNLPLDFIFITGDIGFSGQKNDYTLFQQQFVKPMTDLIGLSTQWLMVPGNHDVDRVGVKRVNRTDILADKNAVFEPTEAGLVERKWLLPGLKNYCDHLSENWLATHQGVFHCIHVNHGTKVGILGINTAWLSQNDLDKGYLTPGKALVEQGLDQIKDCPIKIVLGHHPIQNWIASDQEPIKALFRKFNVLYLHGHLHENRIEREPEFLTLQAGAAFQGREDAQWKNRLMWGEINLNHVLLTPYVWAEQFQTWTVDSNAFDPRHQVQGQQQWAFELPTRAKCDVKPELESAAKSIHLAKLPIVSGRCFGRESVVEQLNQALADKSISIFTLVAWGGVGKTTLVGHWLNRLQQDNYRNIQRAFGWSFYSQGTAEDRQASSDYFINAALRWLGDKTPTTDSLWDKGERLAMLICEQPTLLILDGLEPLQYPPGDQKGCLKDQGIQALLRQLADATVNSGLCVITTRITVADLARKAGVSVREIQLEKLSREAGVELLSYFNVHGATGDIKATVDEYCGHALALTLLGSFIQVVHDGDIRKRDVIPALMDEPEKGRQAKRVLTGYDTWLKAPEKRMLNILGLFDRPADDNALQALRRPGINGLTDGLTDTSWKFTIKYLRDLKLLAEAEVQDSEILDCHPLVREFYASKLRTTQPEVWKAAHQRLYEHYQSVPTEHQPDRLEDLEPLYRAVVHGCLAGCVRAAMKEVYYNRINRKGEDYSIKKLSAFGPDLAVIMYFFDEIWHKPCRDLEEVGQAVVLNWASYRLRALGRLQEAKLPMTSALQRRVDQKNWMEAAKDAINLSELQLTLGDIPNAVVTGRKGVDFADLSKDLLYRIANTCVLADALLQSNDFFTAEKLFRQAENLLQSKIPHRYLFSLEGQRYCELLLAVGKYRAVKTRATKSLTIAENHFNLVYIALDRLLLGRCILLQTLQRGHGDFHPAQTYLDQAVSGLRDVGDQSQLPKGLLARAASFRAQSNYPRAWKDLEETRDIVERSEMKLFLTDYHLEATLLCRDQGVPFDTHVETAKMLIEQTGYHRRDEALAQLSVTHGSPTPLRKK